MCIAEDVTESNLNKRGRSVLVPHHRPFGQDGVSGMLVLPARVHVEAAVIS